MGAAFCFLLFFLLTAIWIHHALQPVNKKGENQNFVVEEGATLKQVAVDLVNADIIRSSTLFRLAGRLMGPTTTSKQANTGSMAPCPP